MSEGWTYEANERTEKVLLSGRSLALGGALVYIAELVLCAPQVSCS